MPGRQRVESYGKHRYLFSCGDISSMPVRLPVERCISGPINPHCTALVGLPSSSVVLNPEPLVIA